MSRPSSCYIQVQVRLRPAYDPFGSSSSSVNIPWQDTYDIDKGTVVGESETTLTVKDPLSNGRCEHYFQFTKVHPPETSQNDIFVACGKPLVDRLLEGYSGCVFAYGQTGSGKTHSVFGPNLLRGETLRNGNDWEGILPRSVRYLFKRIEEKSKTKECGLVASFVEIYLDQIRDLGLASCSISTDQVVAGRPQRPLSAPAGHSRSYGSLVGSRRPNSATGLERARYAVGQVYDCKDSQLIFGSSPGKQQVTDWESQNLELHETPTGQVFVKDLTLLPIRSVEEMLDIVRKGSALRATYETAINSVSSRSHTIFSLNLVTRSRGVGEGEVISGILNFVDLAGSERLAKSRSEGVRFQEAVIVNSSLSALSKVILALTLQDGGGRKAYVIIE